jgi:hypothetical protein
MPHALIPDGFTLKKVTTSEERAVNNKRRHDNVQTLLENPATIPVVASSLGLLAGGVLVDRILKFLADEGVEVSASTAEKTKDAIVGAAFAITPQNLILETGLFAGKVAGISKKDRDEAEQRIRDLFPGL